MGVEVVRGHHQAGAEILEKYPEGVSISVDDGHLVVRVASSGMGAGKAIAVFAPKSWEFGRVTEADAS